MKKWIAVLPLVLLSTSVLAADWQVKQAHSKVSFISIKQADVAEVHDFKQVSGNLTSAGAFNLTIDLVSVDTSIEIRDERMQAMLFEVAKYPQLQLSSMVNPQLVADLSVGSTLVAQIDGTIELHGKTKKQSFDVLIAKLSDTKMVVTSMSPVIVQAADFGLTDGVNKLREIAGLGSISLAVPVSFVLTLSQ
ncbi:YceI family protein [Shewanella sp. 5_MG-2023]|uniref:YceI family protein n=1 Tax=Shewanella sp. 5_MG-2023 TaxID=3062656 RepID=UPI0026E299D3|nr:YceI family protein [Shewanella sp. 5_MG-2023]MDO6640413.1 YceI family protein [Shewanella sp. 5_MG-2023]